MERSEYEQRRRALEAQRQADVELIEAGYLAKIRSLEALWAASQAAEGVPEGTREAEVGTQEGVLPPTTQAVGAQAPPPAPERLRSWETFDAMVDALPALPVEFDTNDMVRALPGQPHKSSFYRAIQELVQKGTIEVCQRGSGTRAQRYRKLVAL